MPKALQKKALIETKELEKTFGEGNVATKVLRGISLQVEPGEFVAIMGPSGSGKSTLLHILGFLDEPTGGEYFFEKKPVHSYSLNALAHIRNARIGFVFQSFNLLGRTSVLDNVKLPLQYSSVHRERERTVLATAALESVGLGHRLTHQPSQLSGGEKQRAAIARALINKPGVLLADEPTGNLDTKSGNKVMDIFKTLHKAGQTIIMVTHDHDVAAMASRLIFIRDGSVEQDRKMK